MAKMREIHDDDLATLEQLVPELCGRIGDRTTNTDRAKIRRVQEVLKNVRWNYQPHSGHEQVEGDPSDGD